MQRRGRIAQPIIQRTYCGATSEVPLKTDIYSLVAEYGIQKQRVLYPANEDHGSQIAAVAGLWQRYHAVRMCRKCASVRPVCFAHKERAEKDGGAVSSNPSAGGFLQTLARAATSVAQAVLGVTDDVEPDNDEVIGGPVRGSTKMSYQRRQAPALPASVRCFSPRRQQF